MLFFAIWALSAIGCTIILTKGKVFLRPREWVTAKTGSTFFDCPMCVGFWVGVLFGLLLPLPELQPLHRTAPIACGFVVSYLSWFGYILPAWFAKDL